MHQRRKQLPTLEKIFQDYKDKVYRLVLSLTKNASQAEDIVQDVFLKIIKNISRFKGKAQLSTWIYRIAYNEALMYLRTQKKNKQRESVDSKDQTEFEENNLFVNQTETPESILDARERKEHLEQILAALPIKYRMVLLLRISEGLSIKKTAAILKLTETSVKSRLHRTLGIIRTGVPRVTPRPSGAFCTQVTKFVHDYADKALDKPQQARFTAHLRDCPDCRSFLTTYAQAIRITKTLQCVDIPPVLQKKIQTFIARSTPATF
jgi:RNA polymerase sigma-70 factor (ECF subfamily)